MISTSTLVPPPPSTPAVHVGVVVANDCIATNVWRMRMRFDDPPAAAPGQFIHLLCDSVADDVAKLAPHVDQGPGSWHIEGYEACAPHPFLRRPFSISRVFDDGLETIIQVIDPGLGTRALATFTPGDRIDCLGPLGHGFDFPDGLEHALLIGGGVGVPPMIETGAFLRQRGVDCLAIAAARSRNLMAVELRGRGADTRAVDFENVDVPCEFATDDGSLGHPGLITAPLEQHLHDLADQDGVAVFACGPIPMLKAVAQVAAKADRHCQVLMEEIMGCAVGVCLACVVKVRAATEPGYAYKRVCTEGPAFDATTLVWD